MKKNTLISDALLIAAGPLFGYLILKNYYTGAESNLEIPQTLSNINIYQSIELGFTLLVTVAVIFCLSDVASRIIKPSSPEMIRYRRIAQVSIFIATCIALGSIQGSSGVSSAPEAIVVWLIFVLITSVPFLIRDILFPLYKHRQLEDKTRRLTLHRSDKYFTITKEYYKSFLSMTNIAFLIIPILIVNVLAFNSGASTTQPYKSRDYIIVNSNPKRVVLINYGDSWLTAEYVDSPKWPGYREKYKIIGKEETTKDSFEIKTLPMMIGYKY